MSAIVRLSCSMCLYLSSCEENIKKKCNMTEIYFQLESLLDFICTFVMLLGL